MDEMSSWVKEKWRGGVAETTVTRPRESSQLQSDGVKFHGPMQQRG